MLTRIVVAICATAGAGALAVWLGAGIGMSLVAGALAAGALAAGDAWRGRRVARWLHEPGGRPAPRVGGLWSEIAYRAERALRESQQAAHAERNRLDQFLAAIDASPNGVLLLDTLDQIAWCNAKAADHFGIDPARDRLQPVTNLIRIPAFVAHLHGGRLDEPVLLRNPAGAATLSVTVRPFDVGMKLVLSHDVTAHERAESMRRDFVANVSHEIRTPLTVLAGFVDSMRKLPLSDAERQQMLTLMAQQTDRMGALVGDLLTLARLDGSPRPPPDAWFALDALLGAVEIDALALSAGRHTIAFPPVTDVRIAGSEAELRSALGNLVSNAVRYTPEGGRIDVDWTFDAEHGGVLGVRDTGIGVAREHLGRLTERFYRVDGGRSRDSGGTGLGLAIVKHVAQRHGGTLDIASQLGRGSTFRIVLPPARVRVGNAAGSSAGPRLADALVGR
ncbi:phosphate regulon sensor histidine kinase PhoR [Piscinibacter koreensis]|uniref:Phosphate regulon sensor protein PhoR n=1 Tax=Piscinibacter koreensis TaxID=2742824 RepID=A0A7Y6TY47_9BURK|nr:phosphate regulon sensor histidine kinase PhoR [Schlegelella koreensis]NUZ07742.1 phosphate regulon sensor histidine kinase PhoR [Schlegelella koreensis]